jgi:hypothetical protein
MPFQMHDRVYAEVAMAAWIEKNIFAGARGSTTRTGKTGESSIFGPDLVAGS